MTVDYLDSVVLPEKYYYIVPFQVKSLRQYLNYMNKYHNRLYSDYNRIVVYRPKQIGWEVNS
jgi:hypothetical protein